jgi:hypothetical protein
MKANIILKLAICFFLFSTQSAWTQHLVPGITAGASLNSADLKESAAMATDLDNLNGVEAGLFLSFSAGSLYFRPMAVASFLRGTVTSTVDGVKMDESNFELTSLETPLLVGFKLFPGFAVEGGPSWNYLMSYTKEINGVNLDLDKSTLGYRAGARATFSRFGVFAHYGGIIDVNGDSDYELHRASRIIFGATFDLVDGN